MEAAAVHRASLSRDLSVRGLSPAGIRCRFRCRVRRRRGASRAGEHPAGKPWHQRIRGNVVRGLLLSCVLFGLVLFACARPMVGVILFYWIGLMNPHLITWGPGMDLPWAMLIFGA